MTVNEKQSRDRAVLGALHPGIFDNIEIKQTDAPDFDAGVRGDAFDQQRPDPRSQPISYKEPGGWNSVEIEDAGVDWFYPWMRGP